ncbi:uncharacterized protein LOC108668899 [Hyalella azteca]|uniref:Uncharacterized protein LOC108668899 n=1 Tax=Hyalella azteca TaxID=294128 RepID=A0A8B7NDS6_HYAAZ|nr:uncharacterized protein LOC108668899 [Hyalella azteca]
MSSISGKSDKSQSKYDLKPGMDFMTFDFDVNKNTYNNLYTILSNLSAEISPSRPSQRRPNLYRKEVNGAKSKSLSSTSMISQSVAEPSGNLFWNGGNQYISESKSNGEKFTVGEDARAASEADRIVAESRIGKSENIELGKVTKGVQSFGRNSDIPFDVHSRSIEHRTTISDNLDRTAYGYTYSMSKEDAEAEKNNEKEFDAITDASVSQDSRITSASLCKLWQHSCADGTCIGSDNYCDGVVHCADYTDEPPGCTACNRTYHGLTGRSYLVTVPSQPSARAPPATAVTSPEAAPPCYLSFSATGGPHGDIVQLTFEKFSVGKYTASVTRTGRSQQVLCEGSYVSIEEASGRGGGKRGAAGGRWCGEGEGTNIFYSEGSSVTVKIITARKDQTPTVHIRYRFLSRSAAVVRFGTTDEPKFRGESVSNTECSKVFRGCRTKACVLQSPNFPGFYMRNLTCYYLVKALPAPSAQYKPVISLNQPNNRLIHVGDNSIVSRISPEVLMQRDCPGDHISIYDGGEMKTPLLVKFCGSTSLPNITSSGPEMLVVFHSSASGRMNHPPNMVVGFELLARELYKSEDSGSDCSVHITSFNEQQGVIKNPSYAMPSNSSCVYQFTGKKNEIIWLYFSKYYRQRKFDASFNNQDCKNGLIIKEFSNGMENYATENKVAMGRFCDEINPPVCIRSKHKNRISLPCSEKESFLSSTSNVSVTQRFTDGTSLFPLEYILHYEFITVDDLDKMNGRSSCTESYSSASSKKGTISSPKSVFMFGRGGTPTLNCSHTFSIRENEILNIKISQLHFKNTLCKSPYDYHYDSYRCLKSYPNSATLRVVEEARENLLIEVGCLCDNKTVPVYFTSHAKALTLIFTIKNMSYSQDHTDFAFEAEYEYETANVCQDNRIVTGNWGVLSLGNSSSSNLCDSLPWSINGSTNYYIHLSVPGSHPSSSSCTTNNRIIIFYEGHPMKSICPSSNTEENRISVFSAGWHERGPWHELQQIFFRYIGREPGTYSLLWLEITRDPQPPALESVAIGGGHRMTGSGSCPSECPEISACINASLFCDGIAQCPSGADEVSCHQSSVAWLHTLVLLGSGTAVSVIAVTVLGITATHVIRQGKLKKRKKKQAQQLMSPEVLLPLSSKNDSYFSS